MSSRGSAVAKKSGAKKSKPAKSPLKSVSNMVSWRLLWRAFVIPFIGLLAVSWFAHLDPFDAGSFVVEVATKELSPVPDQSPPVFPKDGSTPTLNIAQITRFIAKGLSFVLFH